MILSRQLLCVGATPAILLAVFASQIYQVRWNGLNPWRGAGFGMFASVDSPNQRLLRVYLVTRGREFPLSIPRDLGWQIAEARALPTPARLAALGEAMLTTTRD